LISLMDVVFNKKIEEVVKEINIEDEIKNAVISEEGEIGRLLRMVRDYEKDDVEAMSKHLSAMNLTADEFNKIMMESFNYACNLTGDC